MKIISRNDDDATRFFMGKPCKRGHSGKRYVSSGGCLECHAIRNATPETRAYKAAQGAKPETKSRVRARLYGMILSQDYFILAGQRYRCAICASDDPGGRGGWHVDHCHASNEVRGVLCHHCNVGLGHFKDEPERLSAAIEYLKQHQCPQPN